MKLVERYRTGVTRDTRGRVADRVTGISQIENKKGTLYDHIMDATLLSRHTHTTRPGLNVLEGMALVPARLHEICGPARHRLALMVAAATHGPVFWIAPDWQGDRLNPDGVVPIMDPGRITFVSPRRAPDLLWTLEEVLRAGVVPLAVAELPALPGLTAVRRLHLAAESGAAEGAVAPLGLILTQGDGGAPGVESRWHMAAAHRPGCPGWTVSRRRARTLPPASWRMTPGKDGMTLAPCRETDLSVQGAG